MITLIHSFKKSLSTDAKSVSNTSKACYLLADKIPIIGDAEAYIHHVYDISKMATVFKAKFMFFEFKQTGNQKLIDSMNVNLIHKKIFKSEYNPDYAIEILLQTPNASKIP